MSSTSSTARWIGTRLRDERKRLGLSQQALASRAGVSQSAIALWERGQRTPGIEELLSLSRSLDKDVDEFLPRTSAVEPIRAVLRAESPSLEQGELAAELDEVLDRAEQMPPPSPEWSIEAVEPSSAAEEILTQADVQTPPVNIEMMATKCGVRLVAHRLPPGLSGAIIELEDGPVIAVNSDQFPGRQRFTIAHELGHHLLRHHDRFHIDLADPTAVGEPPGYNWLHEREANEFAARVLMPATLVRQYADEAADARSLADAFDVSPLAMTYRLRNLGIRHP